MRNEAVPTPSGAGVAIQNRLMGPDGGSEKLLVMLPGNNYSCDAPAFFYLRQAAIQAGWDVLSTTYAFQVVGGEIDGPTMLADVRAAVDQVLPKGYREVCICAKSLGSLIALPLARPGLLTLGAYTFLNTWNQYLWPLLVTNTRLMRTVQIGVRFLMNEEGMQYHRIMAGVVLCLVPALLILLWGQRYLVRGMMAGGVKG